jgi:DNA replication and repair protein RecF
MTFQPFQPLAETGVYRRRLPHWRQDGVTYFITWRLADALPREKLEEWRTERRAWLAVRGLSSPEQVDQLPPEEQHKFHNHFSERLEEWLDASLGSRCLANPDAASAVETALRFFDGERYALGEFVVMPTHVHVLVTPAPEHELARILQSWKTNSAKAINAVLGRTGTLWMDESCDHVVRSAEHLAFYEGYIRENPKKAGLREGEYRAGRGSFEMAADAGRGEGRLQVGLTLGGLTSGSLTSDLALTALKLRHFRCFAGKEVEFAPGLNLIVGPNAEGKTSLLEAACVLLRLQSPRVTRLVYAIQHERRGFVVDGYFGPRHLQFYFSRERKKLALDEVEQKTAREYLEVGRVVWFSNADIDLVRGSGEGRRRFLDFVAVQRNATYRRALRDYERALRSRNLLLKAAAPRWREIEAFDEPLLAAGNRVIESRRRLLLELQPEANAAHGAISGARESLRLEYVPGAGEDFAVTLSAAREEDARLRQTSVGPHRDDVRFLLNEVSSEFASEGQQRTLVLALKLGAARLLERHFGAPPVLLLDDIFGELDLARRNALLAALPPAAQKLITTTHLDWMPAKTIAQVLLLGEDAL